MARSSHSSSIQPSTLLSAYSLSYQVSLSVILLDINWCSHRVIFCFAVFVYRIYFSAADQPLLVLYVLHVLSAPLQGMVTRWCLRCSSLMSMLLSPSLLSLSLSLPLFPSLSLHVYRSIDFSCLCFGQRHSQEIELAQHKGRNDHYHCLLSSLTTYT